MTFSNYKMESQDISGCYYSRIPHNYGATLDELLRTRDVTPMNDKTGLSPNGIFKYFDREIAKSSNTKYGRYMKNQRSNEKRIRRPLNCFMVFSHLERKRVADEHPELHNADLSKILGKRWKGLTSSERQPYIAEAERIRQLHTEMYPDYKYQPRRKTQGKKVSKKSDNEEESNEIINETTDKVKNVADNTIESIQALKEKDIPYRSQENFEKKQNFYGKNEYIPSCQQMNSQKGEYCGGNFPDYGNPYYHEKHNDDYLLDAQYSYQHINSTYEHSSLVVSPIISQSLQIGKNNQNTRSIQSYDYNNIDSITNTDIKDEMTSRDNKQMLFPNYCKENVKSVMNMNHATSYQIDNNNFRGNHVNDIFFNQCDQNVLNFQTLDNDYIDDGYPKTMPLVKNEMTASFTNIIESLQNIH